MKALLGTLLGLSMLASSTVFADNTPVITIFTTSSWSNIQIVNINNPGIVCYESRQIYQGATLSISQDDMNGPKLQRCFAENGYGLIFYGSSTRRPFPPQFVKPHQRCVASYKVLGMKVEFSCQNM